MSTRNWIDKTKVVLCNYDLCISACLAEIKRLELLISSSRFTNKRAKRLAVIELKCDLERENCLLEELLSNREEYVTSVKQIVCRLGKMAFPVFYRCFVEEGNIKDVSSELGITEKEAQAIVSAIREMTVEWV